MGRPVEQRTEAPHVTPVRATWWRIAVSGTAFLALVSLCLQYGFDEPLLPVSVLVAVQLVAVAAYVSAVGVLVVHASTWGVALRRYGWELGLILLGALVLWGEYETRRGRLLAASTVYVVTMQIFLVARFLIGAIRWNLEMSQRELRPGRMILVLFCVVIAVGGCLLSLPKATSPALRADSAVSTGERVVGCFFTATSATCVTGLAVFDTAHDFTRFGQAVILVLIQLGGLGIMIFASLFGVLAGRQLSLRHSLALQDAYSRQTIGQMRATIRFIVLATFACELVGAVMCYPMFHEPGAPWTDGIFHAVFHAVSAFCNAGFALQTDSLVGLHAAWGVYAAVMPLIILGGLGFPVLRDLGGWCAWRWRAARARRVRAGESRARYRLKLHTRLVLTTSLFLTLVPAVLFFAFESMESPVPAAAFDDVAGPPPMRDLDVFARGRAALFQSVTARTAGFNSVPLDSAAISPASHFLLMLLMFVGGSPASTAGGVKTIAFSVLLLAAGSTLRGRNRAEAFGRTIPRAIVERAAVVTMLMGLAVALTTLGLCLSTPGTFREILFEAVSACGTVGLSAGLTAKLTLSGRLIIMLAMFAGRLGPLTVLIALAGGQPPARYEYPTEQLTIG
jgi:trk system potassium uptake protein TrkH